MKHEEWAMPNGQCNCPWACTVRTDGYFFILCANFKYCYKVLKNSQV